MRRVALSLVTWIVLAVGAGVGVGGGAANAQPAVAPAPAAAAPAAEPGPPTTMRKVEALQGRPSGFWTSTRPATGGAYRWRMLGVGALFAVVTGVLLLRAVRRASAERQRRQSADAA